MMELLVFLLIFSAVLFAVRLSEAEEKKQGNITNGDWEYAVQDDGTISIESYKGGGDEAAVPDELDGRKVTRIGNYAFADRSFMTSITIPDGVTSIGEYAFSECWHLESFTIPDSVTSIGQWAFYTCVTLTSITIPDGMTHIGERAFLSCVRLTSITIPDSVTSIGDDAFLCSNSLIVTVSRGSYAHQYCVINGISYTYADADDLLKH